MTLTLKPSGNIEKKIMMVQTNQKKAPIYICEASQEDVIAAGRQPPSCCGETSRLHQFIIYVSAVTAAFFRIGKKIVTCTSISMFCFRLRCDSKHGHKIFSQGPKKPFLWFITLQMTLKMSYFVLEACRGTIKLNTAWF